MPVRSAVQAHQVRVHEGCWLPFRPSEQPVCLREPASSSSPARTVEAQLAQRRQLPQLAGQEGQRAARHVLQGWMENQCRLIGSFGRAARQPDKLQPQQRDALCQSTTRHRPSHAPSSAGRRRRTRQVRLLSLVMPTGRLVTPVRQRAEPSTSQQSHRLDLAQLFALA